MNISKRGNSMQSGLSDKSLRISLGSEMKAYMMENRYSFTNALKF